MRSTMLSRRRSAAAAISVIAALTLAACGTAEPADTSTAGDDKEVTLRVYWWGGDARHQRTQEAIDAFEEKHPNITIEGEFADWSGYWDKLATGVAGNNAPDVVQMDEMYLASYADRGVLADLGSISALDTSAFDESVLGLGQLDGKQYAMPISTAAWGVLVNDDLMAQLGLTLPDSDKWTWEEFDQFAASVSAASGGEIVGISSGANAYSVRLWARQNGEELFKDGAVSISPATMAGYFQLVLDWTKSGAAAPASVQAETASLPLDQLPFSTGKQALLFSQVSQISAYADAAGGANISVVQQPTEDANGTPYMYLKPGMYWSVTARSEHPVESAMFVDFMLNSEEAGEILGTERGIPANPQVRDAIASTLTPNEQKALDFTARVEENLGEAPEITPNGASSVDQLIARYTQEVTFERLTPLDAAEGFIKELQASIDAAG